MALDYDSHPAELVEGGVNYAAHAANEGSADSW